MTIQKLEIWGFRSLRHTVWEPGSLNILIGPNGSGKSNLLRALMLLKSAAEGKLSDTILAWGGMTPLMWDGRTQEIRLDLSLQVAKDVPVNYELLVKHWGLTGDFWIELEELRHEQRLKQFKRTRAKATLFSSEKQPVEIESGWFKENETLLWKLAAGLEVSGGGLVFEVQSEISEYGIYHDVRVDSNSEIRRAAVARRDSRVQVDASNLIPVLHTLYSSDRSFKSEVHTVMKAAFGDEFEELVFPPAEDGRVQLRVRWRSLKREQSAGDLSDGTLRFLFLLAVLGSSNPPSLIAIDEPETGLHPSMLPLVAELATDAARRTQVILTTHSPQFLNAFHNRADIVTIAESREGQTYLRKLSEPDLARWLEHYQLGDLWLSGELESAG